MSDVDITVQPSSNVSVEVSNIGNASSVSFSSTSGILSSTSVQSALDELEERKFVGNSAPAVGVTDEGDLWYDTDDDIMYVRNDTSWTELVQGNLSGTIDGGTY